MLLSGNKWYFMNEYFTGEYNNTLDQKGRIALPSKLRAVMNSEIVWVTKGLGDEKSLLIYSQKYWEKTVNELKDKLSIYNKNTRWFYRRFISPAREVQIDKNGRIAIPQSLREYAGLKKECLFLGMNTVIELWDVDTYTNEEGKTKEIDMSILNELQ